MAKEIRITTGEGTDLGSVGIFVIADTDDPSEGSSIACQLVDLGSTDEVKVTRVGRAVRLDMYKDGKHTGTNGPTRITWKDKKGEHEKLFKDGFWKK